MARDPISKLYERHRSFPDGKNSENHPRPQDANRYHRHEEIQRPQSREDQHDNAGGRYDNDVSKRSWLQNGDGTSKPFFDKGADRRDSGKRKAD
jgi:hypothetical protein